MKYYTIKGPIHDYFNTLLSLKKRIDVVQASPATPVKFTHKTNLLAEKMHPESQTLLVTAAESLGEQGMLYTLRREDHLPVAVFRAGQYLAFTLHIGNAVVTRPFSIASAPEDALRGEYRVLVARKPGLASTYIFDHWTVGTEVLASAPEGKFYYEPLRDAACVLCVTTTDGLGAALSLARAVADGTEAARLQILYVCPTVEQIACRGELDRLQKGTAGRVQVHYFLTNQKKKGYKGGVLNGEALRQLLPVQEPCSVFVSAHDALYFTVRDAVAELALPKKYVRFEDYGELPGDALSFIPEAVKAQEFACSFFYRDAPVVTFRCRGDRTLLSAMEEAGIVVPSHCHSGECGFCRMRLAEGEVYIAPDNDGRRIADKKFGYIHPCATYPASDVTLRL